ncbi:MAG: hypothetical protein FWC79_00245 [Oscillospiraceae bacterium]|nr:hypothetical protein [Oscillospiraceae bacterium]
MKKIYIGIVCFLILVIISIGVIIFYAFRNGNIVQNEVAGESNGQEEALDQYIDYEEYIEQFEISDEDIAEFRRMREDAALTMRVAERIPSFGSSTNITIYADRTFVESGWRYIC